VQARTQNAAVTSHSVSTSGRYVKITLLTPEQGAGGNGRIYEFEVYGT
jgi:hypothetical protein